MEVGERNGSIGAEYKVRGGNGSGGAEWMVWGRNGNEQFILYSTLFNKYQKMSVPIRTVDICSNKNLPCLSLMLQKNPYLGLGHLEFTVFIRK